MCVRLQSLPVVFSYACVCRLSLLEREMERECASEGRDSRKDRFLEVGEM